MSRATDQKDTEETDLEDVAKIASTFSNSHWKFFMAGLDPSVKDALQTALQSHKELSTMGVAGECPPNVEEGLPFLLEQFERVTDEVSAMSKDITKIEHRTTNVELARRTMGTQSNRTVKVARPQTKRPKPRATASREPTRVLTSRRNSGHAKTLSRMTKESPKKLRPSRPTLSLSRSNNPPKRVSLGGGRDAGRKPSTPGGTRRSQSPNQTRGRDKPKRVLHTAQSLAHLPLDHEHTRRRVYKFGTRKVNMIVPTEGYPTPKEALDPVEGHLELTHIHGYSGCNEQSRQNLYVSPDGTYLIYFIAAVCVVRNLHDGSQQFFRGHNDDITTICIDPREGSTLAASGQKDPKDTPGEGKDLPKIWIWDYTTMRKRKLIDNVCERSILRLQWSAVSGNLFCVCGDENQQLKIFDPRTFRKRAQPEPIFDRPLTKEEVLGMEISPYASADCMDDMVVYCKRRFLYAFLRADGDQIEKVIRSVPIQDQHADGEKAFTCAKFIGEHRYVVGGVSGGVYMCHARQCLAYITAHEKSVGDMIWTGQEMITTGHDKAIRRWAVGDNSMEEVFCARDVCVAGSDFVLSPRAMALSTDNVLYVGTKSNQVLRFEMDTQTGTVIVDGHDGQVWGLTCHPTLPIYVTAGWDRAIKLWDANTLQCVGTYEFELDLVEFPTEEKPWRLMTAHFSPNGDLIAVGTTDSRIALFQFEPLELLCVHQIPPKTDNAELEAVSYLRFNSDGTMLACAHMDALLYIFDIDSSGDSWALERWNGLYLQNSALTHMQWSDDSRMIKTFTRDYDIMHWFLDLNNKTGLYDPNIPDPDQIIWFDDPIIAGWDVEGLYQPGWDGTDLNDATITADGALIASGDDYGTVRLHNYPAVNPRAHRSYTGHAEFVVGVEFLHSNDEYLISCGGADMSIFQWRLRRDGQE